MYIGLNYIPHNKHAKTSAKATLGYNETRLGKNGEEIERQLFDKNGPRTKEQAEWQIKDAPPNTYFWRMRLSPDPNGENAGKTLDLWELTRDAVRWLEERLGRPGEIGLIGAEHNDHTEIAHIHAILLIERRGREKILTKDIINEFREAVAKMALDKKQDRQLAMEQHEAQQQHQRQEQQQQRPVQVARNTRIQALPEYQHFERPIQRPMTPSYQVARQKCPACAGEEAQKQLLTGVEVCRVCGRYLGQGREVALSR
jgi:hypothetical protein